MGALEVILVVLGIVAFVVFGTIVSSKKSKKLRESGKTVARANNFHRYIYYFTTSVGDFSAISAAIDVNLLRTMKISVKLDIPGGRIVFQMRRRLFVAALQREGPRDEVYVYSFGFLNCKESVGGWLEGDDSANALLTAVERAFMHVDPYATVESAQAAFKERFF